jgi:GNAT superfamily N-acetyltransferase
MVYAQLVCVHDSFRGRNLALSLLGRAERIGRQRWPERRFLLAFDVLPLEHSSVSAWMVKFYEDHGFHHLRAPSGRSSAA